MGLKGFDKLDLAGARVLTTRLPKANPATSLQGQRLSAGILVARIVVDARPSPWRAPTTTRSGHAFKNQSLMRWQEQVREACRAEMRGMAPYSHPVRLEITFCLTRIKGRTLPDLSNLVKATEDATQKIVISNDRLVCEILSRRIVGDTDGATILVYASGDR